MEQLRKVKFPNLQEIVFHSKGGGQPTEAALLCAADIIGVPSIGRLGLIFLIFRDVVHDVQRLFEHFAPRIQSLFIHQCEEEFSPGEPALTTLSARPKIKQLRLSGTMSHAWLVNHPCPFDFSELCNIDCSHAWKMEAIELLLDRSRLTISRFLPRGVSNTHRKHYPGHTSQESAGAGLSGLKGLGRFPTLMHLTVLSLKHDLHDVDILLASLPPFNRLAVLRLEMTLILTYHVNHVALLSLGSTLAGMFLPALRRIEASVGKVRFGSGSGHFSPNAEPELHLRFMSLLNREPERRFRSREDDLLASD
ncbi:hypothetical protein C8R44DRAFT_726099 [Mycena epipterygia]|nr:hypothetical protein C8R44DRAFT_726099 [Mycena epipterygia]